MLKKAKQELLSFLLRKGKHIRREEITGLKLFKWIKTVQFSDKWKQETFKEYLAEVYSLKAKIALMDMKIKETAELEIKKDMFDKLVCFSGNDVTTAVETVVEINDFTRFATAAQFVSYIGSCPGQDSIGRSEGTRMFCMGNAERKNRLIHYSRFLFVTKRKGGGNEADFSYL